MSIPPNSWPMSQLNKARTSQFKPPTTSKMKEIMCNAFMVDFQGFDLWSWGKK